MIVHDHFDGSAHCVECGGTCKLTGDERAVTEVVRWTLEFAESVHKGWMWDFQKDALGRLVGDPEVLKKLQRRSAETNLGGKQTK